MVENVLNKANAYLSYVVCLFLCHRQNLLVCHPILHVRTTNDTYTASHRAGNSAYNIIGCSVTNYHIGQRCATIYQANRWYANSFLLHNVIVLI